MPSAKTFPLTDMNRSELQQQLIDEMIDGMDHKTMWQILDSYMNESYDKYTDEELIEEVKEYYPHILEESNTNRAADQLADRPSHNPVLTLVCNSRIMNKTKLFSDSNLTDLQSFMFDTMASADMAVDWFCDRHDVNATDDVVDFVVDAHFAFFGE